MSTYNISSHGEIGKNVKTFLVEKSASYRAMAMLYL